MQKIIQAAFPSVDAAEYAASYLQQPLETRTALPSAAFRRRIFQSIRQLLFLPTISPAELNGS